jgi:putative MFS transporter
VGTVPVNSQADSKIHHASLTGMGYFLDGYNLTVIAVFTLILETYRIFPYTSLQVGFVSGSALLGAGIGAIVLGRYSDRIGRKRLYVLYLGLFIIFPVISSLSVNLTMIIIARFFLGVGIGADYAVGPVYSVEMFPDKTRGSGYGLVWAFWSLGASFAFIVGFVSLRYIGFEAWRIALGIIAVPAMFLMIMRLNVPESVRWLDSQKTLAVKSSNPKPDNVSKFEGQNAPNNHGSSFLDLFRGNIGKRTALVWIQWILLDIGSYGFGLYGPLIISHLGFTGTDSFLITALLYVVGFACAVISITWNDRFGRKIIQAIGFCFMGVGMAFLALSQYVGGTLFLIFGITGLALWYGMENIGPGNTMGLYAIELFPTRLRSTSMGSATAITRFVSFLSAFEFPFIALIFGVSGFFLILLGVMLSAFIFTILFTPETKGMTLEEISGAIYTHGKLVVEPVEKGKPDRIQ